MSQWEVEWQQLERHACTSSRSSWLKCAGLHAWHVCRGVSLGGKQAWALLSTQAAATGWSACVHYHMHAKISSLGTSSNHAGSRGPDTTSSGCTCTRPKIATQLRGLAACTNNTGGNQHSRKCAWQCARINRHHPVPLWPLLATVKGTSRPPTWNKQAGFTAMLSKGPP